MPEISNGENGAAGLESREQVIERLKQKEFLTTEEAATYFDMSLASMRHYIYSDIEFCKFKVKRGNRIFLNRELLEQWWENKHATLKSAVPLQSIIDTSIEKEKLLLKQREFLTTAEAALYIGCGMANLKEIAKRDSSFEAARLAINGRIFYRRMTLDKWLKSKNKNSVQYKYIVLKISTGEYFIVEAASHKQAKRKLRRLDKNDKTGLSGYRAKKIK